MHIGFSLGDSSSIPQLGKEHENGMPLIPEPVHDMSTAGKKVIGYQERDLKYFLFHEVLLRWGKVQACNDVVVAGNYPRLLT